jgi:acetylornithine/N-succinyldiaminopimelate aminotransferase
MSDTMKEYIAEAEKDLLHTYNRYQIVLDKGEGVHLYDTDGKKYLDFVAGIAVFALGYQNKAYNDALKAQIDKVIHTSNYYYNVPAIEAARKIKKVSGMDRVFFHFYPHFRRYRDPPVIYLSGRSFLGTIVRIDLHIIIA